MPSSILENPLTHKYHMKFLVHIARFIVGALFIFSGFIKLNDPLGFSYKLQEYFAPEVLDLEFLSPYALLLSILLVIVEILLGIALLLGHTRKLTLWLLLAMIAFFTFLTFYSAYFNKVTDCGCFGDAIPLVPWESFAKDVILLVLILFLFWKRQYIQPAFAKASRTAIIFVAFIACMVFGYYVLMHLPWLDFRAYKEGSNIAENMVVPEGAPQAIFEYDWKFLVDGQETIVSTSGGYPQVEGEFVDYETRQVTKGYEPPVHDFSIERGDEDYTGTYLAKENVVVIVAYNLDKTETQAYYNIRKTTEEAIRKGYTVIGLTSSSAEVNEAFVKDYKLPFDFYFTDETALKTIIRANPAVMSLNKGTIVQKLHWNDASDLQLTELPTAKPDLNFELKHTLDSIAILDQKYRKLMQVPDGAERAKLGQEMGLDPADYSGDLWKKQIALDSSNVQFIEKVFKEHGYPGKTLVGQPTNEAAWYVIQHSTKIPVYLDMMKEAGKKDEIPFRMVAMMEDRYLMSQEKEQIYGTQGTTYGDSPSFIWPIKDPVTVNERRKEAGFSMDIEEYATRLFGDGFKYKVITLSEAKEIKGKALRQPVQ